MGKWRTHLAYNNVAQIAQSDNKIYAVSDGALFSVDKQDGQFEFYSKVSGLNGSNISRIEFDQSNKQLLIAYANGNIDLLGSGGVINIPDLYNKQMSASKAINQIKFSDNKAYLSCDFGILVLNMLRKEVLDTYYIGDGGSEVKVWSTTILKDTIYAMTSTGVGTVASPFLYTLKKAASNSKQLVNYANWKPVSNLPGSGDLQSIATFSNKLFLLRGNKLYSQEGFQNWSPFHNELSISNFNVTNGSMNLYAGTNFYLVNDALILTDLSNKGNITDAEYDLANKTYWLAANDLGILSYTQAGVLTPYKPLSPAVNSPFEIKFSGQKMIVVPGGRWAFEMRPGNVMIYEKGEWTNISYTSIEAKTGIICRDLISTAIDPSDNKHFFTASYSSGLYEFKDNTFFKHHNYTNSTIEVAGVVAPGSVQFQMLGGSIFDKNGNLWILNEYVGASIKVLLKNGDWKQLSYTNFSQPSLGAILISDLYPNLKFVTSARGKSGLAIFDDNGTIADQSDDKSRFMDFFTYSETSNGQNTLVPSPATYVSPIAQDKNGVIWVGTTTGPYVFNNLSKVFDADYTCTRVKIPRSDGTNAADYLLKDEEIKAIAIDGANRKWIGTKTSGVYLLSENGQETIKHFTSDNSPLLSNDILSIAINPVNGEVFFGTGAGLISYQGDAADATATFGEVYAYPNPVRQGFTGLITITGLIENTVVKITDLNGNLVCQTNSNGSLATWDGKDIHGRKVNTGIYLALCSSQDGTQSTITKIMVIN